MRQTRNTDLVNGGVTLQPGPARHDYEPTPRAFAEFARLEPSEQLEVIEVLRLMHRGASFNDAILAVRGGPDSVAPKGWARL